MSDLLMIFKMEELSIDIRISLLKKMGELINYQYATNITEPMVEELVGILIARQAKLEVEKIRGEG